jgi:hypothetical protein
LHRGTLASGWTRIGGGPHRALLASGIALTLLASIAAQDARQTPAMSSLTVPTARLPEGCSLAQSAGQRAAPNPWMGNEPARLTEARKAVEPWSVRVPDALPMSQAAERTFTQQAVAGLVEGYKAVYLEFGNTIIVQAIRFERAPEPLLPPRDVPLELGLIRAKVSGPMGPCRKAIEAYLGLL